jgi:hypothetical protein
MTITTGFLIYATLFRLAVLGVGALAVWLGYRLFVQDPIGGGKAKTTSASAEGGGFKVTLSNFWPGAYFALFGTVIIGIMLWQGGPELDIQGLVDGREQAVAADEGRTPKRIRLKGVGELGQELASDIELRRQSADERLAEGDADGALAAYARLLATPELTLGQAAPMLSGAAAVYLEKGRPQEALPLARLAVGLDEGAVTALVTLSRALEATGDGAGAIKAMERAVTLDAGQQAALDALRKRSH